MAKIFLELSTGIGPLIRCLPIAVWLREQGHEVRYFARDKSTRHLQALGFAPIDLDPSRVAYRNAISPDWRDVDQIWGTWGFNQLDWLSDRIALWKQALAAYSPDLVVTDFGILSSITARLLGLPLAAITQSCMHLGVQGGKQSFWLPDYRPQHASRDCVNQLLGQENASLRIERFEELFLGDVTVIPSIPEFDRLEPGFERGAVFAGPVLWDGLSDQNGQRSGELPSAAPAGRPRVFAYTGRMRDGNGNSGELVLRAVLDAARTDAFDLVVSTGGMDQIPADIRVDRPNVKMVEWVPMNAAYSTCDLVIHHGGHGSCLGALKHGVPSLIIPTHTEREYNARLIRQIGCGDLIGKDVVTGERIVEKVRQLLDSSTVAAELERHRRTIADRYADGAAVAGRTILSLLD
jgi:UDP:flavonoid glycosyltransferase YjiC (YdhE family)